MNRSKYTHHFGCLLALLAALLFSGCEDVTVKKENLRVYYDSIRKAENDIVCERYKSAHQAYAHAFQHKQHPFAIDIYNAAKVARMHSDCEAVYDLNTRLASDKGLPMAWFDSKWFCSPQQYDQFKNNYGEFQEKFESRLDRAKQAYFKKIQDEDQMYRQTEDRYTTFADSNYKYDHINAERIYNYITEKGFPTEEEIGLRPLQMDPGFTYWLDIPLLHYVQQQEEYGFKDIMPYLIDEVNKGTLNARDLEMMYSFYVAIHNLPSNNKPTKKIPVSHARGRDGAIITEIMGDSLYFSKIDSTQILAIDSMRHVLYLEPTIEQYRKSLYLAQSNRLGFRFSNTGRLTLHMSNPTAEQFSMAKQSLNLVAIETYASYLECE